MKKYFSNKNNRRQLIIAGIIAVFTALIPTIANIPVTYAEETSPDGKYKLVAQYPLREGIICSLSMAGSGDEGERYVTVFFDAQNQKTIVYGFNIFTGEIARPPVEAINFMNTYLAWFDHCDEDYSIAEKYRDAAKLYYSKKFYLTDGTLCIPQKEKLKK